MQLKYFVPFKAQEGVDAQYALKEKLLNIEGVAIDTGVNKNKWQVPEEDLDFFAETLRGTQLRADHAESVFMIVGKVPVAQRQGQQVFFQAEVGGEEKLIEKIIRGYITHVSVQVDSDEVECSKCKRPTRKEGVLIHLCPLAWEIVHKPKVRELSLVASPAYENTVFKPVGFAAAMDESQKIDFPCIACSQLLKSNKDVGSRHEKPQEPENKNIDEAKSEVKPMSEHDAQTKASPIKAQGAVNIAPGEQAPKQVTYDEYMNQLTQLQKQFASSKGMTDTEVDALNKKVADLEAELGKRAKKSELSKRIAELSKKLSEEGEESKVQHNGAGTAEEAAEETDVSVKRASGKGVVAVDELNKDLLGNSEWFRDILKAHSKLVGFQ